MNKLILPSHSYSRRDWLARMGGGFGLLALADLLAAHPDASARLVVSRWPLWDHPLLWLVLLGILTAEWILRRTKGLA